MLILAVNKAKKRDLVMNSKQRDRRRRNFDGRVQVRVGFYDSQAEEHAPIKTYHSMQILTILALKNSYQLQTLLGKTGCCQGVVAQQHITLESFSFI